MSGKSLNSYWREITSIIEGGLKPDPHRVSSFAGHLAQRLEEDGQEKLARRILRLTDGASRPAGSTYVAQGLPADVESQQFLVEQIQSTDFPAYPALPHDVDLELRRFVELNKRSGELASQGIDPPSTLLLFGPPGCGKTMAATAIACDLGLPLHVIRLDSLLGSFLGNSAKNLRRVFDYSLSRPCVLLLDEFDALAKMRDDTQEVGEVKRLVGSLLQNLDRVQGEQIVIAATNHHHLLDPAIWRRFDVTLHLGKPDKSEIKSIMQDLISKSRLSEGELEGAATLSVGLSGSDVTSVIKRALQDQFLHSGEPLLKLMTRGVLARVRGYEILSYHSRSKKDLVLATNHQAGDALSIRQIARLVDCSPTYAADVIRASEEGNQ